MESVHKMRKVYRQPVNFLDNQYKLTRQSGKFTVNLESLQTTVKLYGKLETPDNLESLQTTMKVSRNLESFQSIWKLSTQSVKGQHKKRLIA